VAQQERMDAAHERLQAAKAGEGADDPGEQHAQYTNAADR
jgi:hypothetical protein